jgi:hypothetical protein
MRQWTRLTASTILTAMFHLHCTKKLLDRIKPEIAEPGQSDTALGNWYATFCSGSRKSLCWFLSARCFPCLCR